MMQSMQRTPDVETCTRNVCSVVRCFCIIYVITILYLHISVTCYLFYNARADDCNISGLLYSMDHALNPVLPSSQISSQFTQLVVLHTKSIKVTKTRVIIRYNGNPKNKLKCSVLTWASLEISAKKQYHNRPQHHHLTKNHCEFNS